MNDEVRSILDKIGSTATFPFQNVESVNQRNPLGDTPLHVVVRWGDKKATTMLIDAGAEINSRGEDGNTPLHDAVIFGNADMVDLLVKRGASVDIRNDDGETPLELAVGNQDIENVLRMKLQR